MVAQIDALPAAPSRRQNSRAQFVETADNFLLSLPPFALQTNAVALEINAAVVLVQASLAVANEAIARAEGAATFKTSFAAESWAALASMVGEYIGQSAAIFTGSGTHVDPVTGATVDNKGIYRWSIVPAGWRWVASGVGTTVAWTDVTGRPVSYTPTAHAHSLSDVTGLETALAGKASTGAIGSAGLTMIAARLLGRATGNGAIQELELGSGLGFVGGKLAYTGGTSMVYPAGAGITVSTGSAWGASLAIPSGDLVGTLASQTLQNKTLGAGTSITAGTISGVTINSATINGGVTVSDSGTLTSSGVGFRGLPLQSATNRTLQASDMGKLVSVTGDVTIPAGLPTGFACTIYRNAGAAGTIYAGASATVRLAGTAISATNAAFRTLAQRGFCYVQYVNPNEYVCSGNI